MQRASSFVDEIRSSLEFYTAQAQGARIARVLVTGGGSKLDGFLDLLRQRIPVQVDPGQVFQRARSQLSLSRGGARRGGAACSRSPSASRSPGGTREPGQPPSPRYPPGAEVAPADAAVVALAGAVLARAGLRVLPAAGQHPEQCERATSTIGTPTNESINAQIAEKQKFAELQAEAQAQAAAARSAYAGEVSFSALLMDTSRVIPSDAYLDTLSLQITDPAAAVEGDGDGATDLVGTITGGGKAVSIDTLATFLTRLESVKGWVNPFINTIGADTDDRAATIYSLRRRPHRRGRHRPRGKGADVQG